MNKSLFTPNTRTPVTIYQCIVGAQIALAMLYWMSIKSAVFPSLCGVLNGFKELVYQDHLLVELASSIKLNAFSCVLSLGLALLISYAGQIGFFKPVSGFAATLRMSSIVGLSLAFTKLAPSQFWLKVYIMTFAMTPWIVVSLNAMLDSVSEEKLDHARTLGWNEWRVLWEVKFLGQRHQITSIFQQVAGMGWGALVVAEKLCRSDGGIGAIFISLERALDLDRIYALLILIIFIGWLQDKVIHYSNKWFIGEYAFKEAKK